MADATIDIVAMGDAIVDVIASCDDEFLVTHGLPKGSMQLLILRRCGTVCLRWQCLEPESISPSQYLQQVCVDRS